MSTKNIIAPQPVIDAAFAGNPHNVKISSLVNYISNVDIGESLFMLGSSCHHDLGNIVKAPTTGFFVPAEHLSGKTLSKKELKTCVLGWLFSDAIDALDFLIGTPKPSILVDPFTKKRNLFCEWNGLLQIDGRFQIGDLLFIKFGYEDNICVLYFHTSADIVFDGEEWNGYYSKPIIPLGTENTVSILFDDDTILDFKSIKKSSFCCELHQEDIDAFSQKTIVATRISYNNDKHAPITIEFNNHFFDIYSRMALILYIKKYVTTIMEIHPHYNLPSRIQEATIVNKYQEYCYVYLMKDTTNGYYKIGISNNPDYRERTLQSEKPSIEMIACKRFPTRKIAMSIESALHTAYSQQRVRGEWFNLGDVDVAAIIETLK